MGMDQSFYVKKQKQDNDGYLDTEHADEVIYFRKYHELQSFISNLMGGTENAEQVRLQPEDLVKVRDFIVQDQNWRFDLDEEVYSGFKPNEEFFRVLGVLTYYIGLDKPLFYIGDW